MQAFSGAPFSIENCVFNGFSDARTLAQSACAVLRPLSALSGIMGIKIEDAVPDFYETGITFSLFTITYNLISEELLCPN